MSRFQCLIFLKRLKENLKMVNVNNQKGNAYDAATDFDVFGFDKKHKNLDI